MMPTQPGLSTEAVDAMRLINGRALVRTEEIEMMSEGLIVVNAAMVDRPVEGRVLAAAEDANVAVGDAVLIARLGGQLLCQDGTTWDSIYGPEEVLATIEKTGGQAGIL